MRVLEEKFFLAMIFIKLNKLSWAKNKKKVIGERC